MNEREIFVIWHITKAGEAALCEQRPRMIEPEEKSMEWGCECDDYREGLPLAFTRVFAPLPEKQRPFVAVHRDGSVCISAGLVVDNPFLEDGLRYTECSHGSGTWREVKF